jgi:hypothetical protein
VVSISYIKSPKCPVIVRGIFSQPLRFVNIQVI